MVKFSNVQRRFLWGGVLIYTVAYLNRLNLSAALGSIASAFALTDAQAGLLQTAFALIYAAGQLVNGIVVDRVSPSRHLFIGVAGYSACNLLLGMAGSYEMLLLLCLLNGAFQSMLWTPLVRMMALLYQGRRQREKVNFAFSLTLVLGHLGAWSIAGYMSVLWGWRFSFLVPGAVGVAVLFAALYLIGDIRTAETPAGKPGKKEAAGGPAPVSLGRLLASTGFLYLLVACLLYGFVRDGIVTWAPQKIREMGTEGVLAVLSSLVIPLLNTLGVIGGYLFKRYGIRNTRRCIALMVGLTALLCLPLPVVRQPFLLAVIMGMGCACLYGSNPLLTTLVPLEYDNANRVSLTAGLVDSTIYIGSALAGVLGGAVTEALGTPALYASWFFCMAAAAVLAFAAGSRKAYAALEGQGNRAHGNAKSA